MKEIHKDELIALRTENNFLPCISLVFPIELQHASEESFKKLLKYKHGILKHALVNEFPHDQVNAILRRFESISDQLTFNHEVKGYAMFLTPYLSKSFQLNFYPSEKLIIDDSFEIRDLLIHNASIHTYLTVMMSAQEVKFLLFENSVLSPVSVDVPKRIEAFMSGTLHDVEIHHEKSERRDKARDLFIHNIDHGIEILQKAYHIPIVLMGDTKFVSHFMLSSKHALKVIETIDGNFLSSGLPAVSNILESHIASITQKLNQKFLNNLEDAENSGLLISGVHQVYQALQDKNVKSIFVEKNYVKAANNSDKSCKLITYKAEEAHFPIPDVIDDMIEMALAEGGEVHFLEDGSMTKWRKLAAIKYY